MELKIIKIIVSIFAVITIAAFLIFSFVYLKSNFGGNFVSNENFNISTSSMKILPYSEPVKMVKPTERPIISKEITKKLIVAEPTKEVSSKSFEELVNSSVFQVYCGYLSADETNFTGIARGTGIIVSSKGEILTNRHIIYDENMKKVKSNCFILKSPFPNIGSEKPKIYYSADILSYPLKEKFNEIFSKDKYYNDFAVLKIMDRLTDKSKIGQLLQTSYASETDFSVIENNGPPGSEASDFNFLPIDWSYQPKDGDILITLGYGVDASHLANKITSTVGKIGGNINININKSAEPQILLIESNATTGFSGGALINPESKGLVGLVSWITAGDITGKYTVAIFRDFLRSLMIQDLNLDLKLLQN